MAFLKLSLFLKASLTFWALLKSNHLCHNSLTGAQRQFVEQTARLSVYEQSPIEYEFIYDLRRIAKAYLERVFSHKQRRFQQATWSLATLVRSALLYLFSCLLHSEARSLNLFHVRQLKL